MASWMVGLVIATCLLVSLSVINDSLQRRRLLRELAELRRAVRLERAEIARLREIAQALRMQRKG